MKTIQVTKENYEAALSVANKETREVLVKLFGNYPTLGDYKTIKSYADACRALVEPIQDFTGLPKDVVAYMKLKTISRALWGENFKPIPDTTGNKTYYYPWFTLYTQKDMDQMSDEQRELLWFGALSARYAPHGEHAGFSVLTVRNRFSYSHALTGFRLCQETEEKGTYLGMQFLELWADYLLFNI